ncbi:hypothetical protein MUBE_00020 [Mycobacterium uberis]|uniref:Uncharacterized protein n=1 Tax=Mycobacterium uberis TaxID=2162698 RepID=A0A3E1HKT9_9MYCO|nr:hypothetical protein [Mycobacterium uberis]RFD27102.1 hypothetical protein MUBE_00020 [Mycobacterium uberis]
MGAQVTVWSAWSATTLPPTDYETNSIGLERTVEIPELSSTTIIMVDANAENTIVVVLGTNNQLRLADTTARTIVTDYYVLLT